MKTDSALQPFVTNLFTRLPCGSLLGLLTTRGLWFLLRSCLMTADEKARYMEKTIVSRLAVLVESRRLTLAEFFRVCALLGVSFTAAAAAISASSAWAEVAAKSAPSSLSYASFVSSDVLEFLNGTRGEAEVAETPPFSDHFFSKTSGDTPHVPPSFINRSPSFLNQPFNNFSNGFSFYNK